MKLAEALQERADLNRTIEQLKYRLCNNVLVQEGEEAVEEPQALKQKLDGCLERLEHLIACINRGGKIIFPRGQDTIEQDDTVIVVTTHSGFGDISDILR